MPCTAAPFLIMLLCPIKQEALPWDLGHIAVPVAPQQSVKSTALVGMSARNRITPESWLGAIIMVSTLGSQVSKATGWGPSPRVLTVAITPQCWWCCSVPAVSPSSKHSLTSRRRAGGTFTFEAYTEEAHTRGNEGQPQTECISKDTVSGLSDVLLLSPA